MISQPWAVGPRRRCPAPPNKELRSAAWVASGNEPIVLRAFALPLRRFVSTVEATMWLKSLPTLILRAIPDNLEVCAEAVLNSIARSLIDFRMSIPFVLSGQTIHQ